MDYELRPATEHDFDFLYALHRETLRDAVDATWGWNEEEQLRRFKSRWEPTTRQIIVVDGEDVGVLQVRERSSEIFLSLVEVTGELQGRGLGTRIVRDLQQRARESGKPITLTVLKSNPDARRLYERLGFAVTDADEVRHYMAYDPGDR